MKIESPSIMSGPRLMAAPSLSMEQPTSRTLLKENLWLSIQDVSMSLMHEKHISRYTIPSSKCNLLES